MDEIIDCAARCYYKDEKDRNEFRQKIDEAKKKNAVSAIIDDNIARDRKDTHNDLCSLGGMVFLMIVMSSIVGLSKLNVIEIGQIGSGIIRIGCTTIPVVIGVMMIYNVIGVMME